MLAYADASLSFSLGVESSSTQEFKYLSSSDLPVSFNSGLQTISVGNAKASLQAWANPSTGMFKSIVSAEVGPGLAPINTANAYASFNLGDTLRFTGPGDKVQVSFSLSHDTVISGMDAQQFSAYEQIDHIIRAGSRNSLSLNYSVANPNYDPAATCIDYGSDGMYCPPETQQTLHISEYKGGETGGQFEYQRNYWTGVRQVVRFGEGDGHYTATHTYTFELPTNVDISLGYSASNNAECYHMANCSLLSDASHSEYFGISVQGGSFTSASQYQYLGLAAAVPEPESALMLLAGLLGLAAWRRSQVRAD
ncbi:PEP-CTERM sorting domain-containing protein [Paucibacter sp. B2R-40]|uniref:PEP-CTERM sorting domain-containing protein n=1 Tax=Paucibacter sp. B2R-40 TaxID=2893554 RepID=UPI0021E4B0BF|nr:PEP-CTERM sorting domain-containing protein [Paucibacter sp. B2R-40]MCV2355978.1 PEP-CTERM sorting domain-containing protein [Paucibacter sp. B2R-40]